MLFKLQAYKEHLTITNDENRDRLDKSIELLKHTSVMVELFSEMHVIYNVIDIRLQHLNNALEYFIDWSDKSKQSKE